MKKIGFVIPWYGENISGGAETELRQLVHHLQDAGLKPEVLSTCVKDFSSNWNDNFHSPGLCTEAGIPVRRFRVRKRNTKAFDAVNARLIQKKKITAEEEGIFLKEMVNSPELYRYMEKHKDEYEFFVFIPYMFGTTYYGAQVCPEKTVLIPCLHDENYAYFELFKKCYSNVAGMVFNSEPERLLAERLYGVSGPAFKTIGIGIDMAESLPAAGKHACVNMAESLPAAGKHACTKGTNTGNNENGCDSTVVPDDAEKSPDTDTGCGETAGVSGEAFRQKYNIHEPFILYAGRKESGKKVDELISFFAEFKKRNQTSLKLVLIGGGYIDIPSEDVIDLGYIPAEDKNAAYAEAEVFCNPSQFESFSIVIMESWLAETPVLVNGKCQVTKDFVIRSNAGLYYDNYAEFEKSLLYMLKHKDVSGQMGINGERFVRDNFSWDVIVKRYAEYFSMLCSGSDGRQS